MAHKSVTPRKHADEIITLDEAFSANARLCNAECMLKLILGHIDQTAIADDANGWQVSEAIRGVLQLLDGCYISIGGALDRAREALRGGVAKNSGLDDDLREELVSLLQNSGVGR
jgi:hypothetical protein